MTQVEGTPDYFLQRALGQEDAEVCPQSQAEATSTQPTPLPKGEGPREGFESQEAGEADYLPVAQWPCQAPHLDFGKRTKTQASSRSL